MCVLFCYSLCEVCRCVCCSVTVCVRFAGVCVFSYSLCEVCRCVCCSVTVCVRFAGVCVVLLQSV